MKCFFCGSFQSSVIDKRAVTATGEIRRRRLCLKCGNRFTTYERLVGHELFVIKRDGSKELFDRNKLVSGVEKALEKRPARESLENLVDKILNKVNVKGRKEVQSRILGKAVLSELKKTDKVAYLRFASVYRQFQGAEDFEKELEHLKI
jgi:transcriptional repressor NrdR